MKQKILIIEDEPTIQTQLKNLLSYNGYQVEAVTDFSKVMEQLKAFAPHLILLDIKLPGKSGFEICSQIRTFSVMLTVGFFVLSFLVMGLFNTHTIRKTKIIDMLKADRENEPER